MVKNYIHMTLLSVVVVPALALNLMALVAVDFTDWVLDR